MSDLPNWGPSILMVAVGLGLSAWLLRGLLRAGQEPASLEQTSVPTDKATRRMELRARKESLIEELRAIGPEAGTADPRHEALMAESARVLEELDRLGPETRRASPIPLIATLAGSLLLVALYLGVDRVPTQEISSMGQQPPDHPAMMMGAEDEAEAPLPQDLQGFNCATHEALLKRDLKGAMRLLEPARKRWPEDPEVMTHRAALQILVGMAAKAEPNLTLLHEKDPKADEPTFWLAVARWHLGRAPEARTLLGELQQRSPESEEARLAAQVLTEMDAESDPKGGE